MTDDKTPPPVGDATEDVTKPDVRLASMVRNLTPSGARRVPPNPDKPKVAQTPELEQAAALSAAGYDALEVAGEAFEGLKMAIEEGAVTATIEIDESLVYKLRGAIKT